MEQIKRNIILGTVLFAAFLFTGCRDEIILIGDTEEIEAVYGEMWNFSSAGYEFMFDDSEDYHNLTGMVVGELQGMNFTDNGTHNFFTILESGEYAIEWHASFSGGNNNLYGWLLAINYNISKSRHCYARRSTRSNAQGNVGGTCIEDLTVGDEVSIMVEDEMNPVNNIMIYTLNVNIVKIGGVDNVSPSSGSSSVWNKSGDIAEYSGTINFSRGLIGDAELSTGAFSVNDLIIKPKDGGAFSGINIQDSSSIFEGVWWSNSTDLSISRNLIGGIYLSSEKIKFSVNGFATRFEVGKTEVKVISSALFNADGEATIGGINSDGTGKVVCIKGDGNLGTCTDQPDGSGVCTCT